MGADVFKVIDFFLLGRQSISCLCFGHGVGGEATVLPGHVLPALIPSRLCHLAVPVLFQVHDDQ